MWLSSGAANKAYTAWAAYGSSKAAMQSISMHLAVEEPDVTSITVAPGRVNTDMQAVVRAAGKESMNKAQYDSFVDAFEQGRLLRPEQPGRVIAAFAASPDKALTGQCLKYVATHAVAARGKADSPQLELGGAGGIPGGSTPWIPASRVDCQRAFLRCEATWQKKDEACSQSKDEKLLIYSTWVLQY